MAALAGSALTAQVASFPMAAVGKPATTLPISVKLTTGGSVSKVLVLTQGVEGQDYQLADGSGCSGSFSAGQQCTVSVSFQPKYPGPRHGAVVLEASDNTVLGATYLESQATGGLTVLVPGVINTVAGGVNWTYSGDGGPGVGAAIFLPMGEVTDAAGNLYIADTDNNRVRRVDAQSGLISTVAGGYIQGYQGDGGQGVNAQLSSPTALAMDGAGNLYIADSGNAVIRMLNTVNGIITTVAGVGGPAGPANDNGPATAAHLTAVSGMAFDNNHNLYIADTGNNAIRKIDLGTGTITRFAGTGAQGYAGDNGPALSATFAGPQGIAFGPDGSLYVADLLNNVIRKISAGGTVTTVAGGGQNGLGDGGDPLQASLNLPAAVAVDQAGNLYIADAGENRIRKVSVSTGKITTIAGNGGETFSGDGGNADQSELYGSYSLYYDGQGNLFVGDMFHNRIREISGTQAIFQYDPIRVDRTSPPKPEGLENDGNDVLNLQAPAFVNASLDSATTTCTLAGTLTVGQPCVLGVAFSPTELGDNVQGSVTLNADPGVPPAVIKLSGQVLSVDPTATTLISSLNPSAVGATVTFTAHVTTQGSSMTGSVQFLDNGVLMGTSPLAASGANGTASFGTATLSLGSHSITAVYSGDATNAQSTSAVLTQSVKQQTALMLNSNPNPSTQGGAVVLTAKVTATGIMPTGDVTFTADGAPLGTGTLNAGGVASFTVSALTIGTHALNASYAGDINNGSSNSNTITQTVNGQASSLTLGTSQATVQVGTSVTFTAHVTGAGVDPTGTVTFKDGGNTIGTGVVTTGVAAFTTYGLAPGIHTITASYSGDAVYGIAASLPLAETIQQLTTVTALSSSANPAAAGAIITLQATVTESAANSPESAGGPISGTVAFAHNGTPLGTATLNAGGLATLSVSNLPLGANNITAVYNGNTNYQGSSAMTLVVTIVQAETVTALTSSPNPSTVEDPVTMTATVTTKGGKPTGKVTFSSDGAVIGDGTLNDQGMASIAYPGLMVGRHVLVASYAGDGTNMPSVSPQVTQAVALHPSGVTLTSSATSLSGGQQVTLIAVVNWTGTIAPTGAVTFQSDSGTAFGIGNVDATGVATLTINPPSGTITKVTATYSGDAVFAGSTSQAVPISVGLPPQFTIAANTTNVQVQTAQHMMVDLTLTSEKGFADTMALGCLGLPVRATCTFTQDRVALPANGSTVAHVMVDTGSPLTAGSTITAAKNESSGGNPLVAVCGLPAGLLFGFAFWKKRRGVLGGVLLMLCALSAMAGLSGCGSINVNSTPAGTYHFQITAAAQGTGVIQAVDMTLTVGN